MTHSASRAPRPPSPDGQASPGSAPDGATPAAQGGAEFYKLLLDNVLDPIHVVDEQGIIRYVTPAMQRLLGWTADELVGRYAGEFLHPDDLERAYAAFVADISQPGSTRSIEVRVCHADGSWRVLDMLGTGVLDASGAPLLLVTSRDTTERIRTEQALRASEERYRRFFEEDLTGDFVSTPDGRLLACNSAFAEILGFASVADALAADPQSLYPDPRTRELVLERLRRDGIVKRLQLELRRLDGRCVHVVENVVGVFDEAGELVEVRGYLFDITEQKRLADERNELLMRERSARAAAEAAQRRTAFLAEIGNALDASLDYRSTLGKLARLLVPRAADYCLIDERTAEGGSQRVATAHVDPKLESLLLPHETNAPDADAARHPVMQVLRTGRPVLVPEMTEAAFDAIGHDTPHREQLRRLGLVSYMIVPLVARGRILGAVTLCASSSGRRYGREDLELMEAVARRAALAVDNARLYGAAQQAARAREEVLAFVSHDLRNPLATILLNASALMELIPEERLYPEEREQLAWIARSSEQMNALIQDLLDVTRIESGRLPLRLQTTSVEQILAEAWGLLQPLAAERGLVLERELPAGLASVRADRERVVRVLSNLVGNAIKFTAAGGRIRLAVEPLGAELRFSVADTGTGIAAEHQAHLFDRYWHGWRMPRSGNGLGLTIARALVEAHGGRIWFESTEGVGTTFFFTLPVAPGAEAPRGA